MKIPEFVLVPIEPTSEMISDDVIRIMALQYGFKLKKQPNGEDDLNPYVYNFARKLFNMAGDQVASAAPTPQSKESYEFRDKYGVTMLNPGPWIPCSKASFEAMQNDKGFETRVVQGGDEASPAQEDEPVAWMIPRITRMPGNPEIDGIAEWEASIFCDSQNTPRVDRNGVKHYPYPLYAVPPFPKADEELRNRAEVALRLLDLWNSGDVVRDSDTDEIRDKLRTVLAKVRGNELGSL